MYSKTNSALRPAQRLGSFTKTYSGPEFIDSQTGEITELELGSGNSLVVKRSPCDARRFAMDLKRAVSEIIPRSRTARVCMHCQAPDFDERKKLHGNKSACHPIEIRKNKDTGLCHFSGLMMCGSVWNCPVCNRQISSHRRDELNQALDSAKLLGWGVFLVTLTVPHGMGDDLKVINDMQRLAINKLSQGRNSISNQLKIAGYTLHGYVRAKEVTYGRHGFHPHFHLLVFTDASQSFLQNLYLKAWQSACVSSGLERPSDERGVDVRTGTDAGDYVAKWGLEFEMTSGHSKKSKKGLSPYQLLHVYNEGGYESDYLTVTKKQAAFLFQQYSEAMKGQRQLFWSRGLREKLGLNQELTDEEILQQRDEETELTTTVSPDSYRAINYFKAHHAVLFIAENFPHMLSDYISVLLDKYIIKQSKKIPFKNRTYKGK